MIRGLGCDLCAISRMEKIMADGRFLHRYFTEEERAYIAARARGAQTAAGIFAAKEALVKALGTGFDGFALADIEIFSDEAGAPHVRLYRGAQARLAEIGALNVMVSISHTKDAAMAVAAAE